MDIISEVPNAVDWSELGSGLVNILDSLFVIPSVLVKVVVDYWIMVQFDTDSFQVWEILPTGLPYGLAVHNQDIFLCDYSKHNLLHYSLTGYPFYKEEQYTLLQRIFTQTPATFNEPSVIDIYKEYIYVASKEYLSILNLKRERITKWVLPSTAGARGLKVDEDKVYLTIYDFHQIFIYTLDGKLLKTFGNTDPSEIFGEFYFPFGLTIVRNHLYVCDLNNHRLQILNKHNGQFIFHWGSYGTTNGLFDGPLSTYFSNGIIYVGDKVSVQLFTRNGFFLQRIGGKTIGSGREEFDHVYSILVVKDNLYVSDFHNHRIKVFRR